MLFSIITPTYNRVSFLSKTIESVLNQSYKNWELIVVDDGSTDNTKKLILNYQKQNDRIKYIYQDNAERSAARNNGIRNAKGKYICFLDSDDYYDNDYLEILYKEINKHKSPKVVFSTGYKTVRGKNINLHKALPSGKILTELLENKSIVPVIQTVHSDILQDYLFNENLSLWEDTHLYFRIFDEYPCISIDKYPINVVFHKDSTVQKGMQQVHEKGIDRYLKAIEDIEQFYKQKEKYKTLLNDYKLAKLQMYIYQARINQQYNLVNQLLFKYLPQFFSVKTIIYFIITFTKSNFSKITRIKVK